MEIKELSLFITLSWLLIISPGPDVLYVLTRGISNGRKAGLISAAGVTLGILVHTAFAAFGLSMILKTSALAFTVVKLAGAVYLIYLGVQAIIARHKFELPQNSKAGGNRIFLQGLMTNVLNPKVALFFMAFLPQFVNVEHGNPGIQFVILGLMFALFTITFLAILGYFSGLIGQYLTKSSGMTTWLQRVSGGILILLGIRLAFVKQE